jgi:hypothetical protein
MRHATAAVVFASALFAAAVAPPYALAGHTGRILVLNAGNEPIFGLRVGDATAQRWSADLLGFDGVVEVGRGRDIAIPDADTGCSADVQAAYQDGHTVTVAGVDLCSGDGSVRFEY